MLTEAAILVVTCASFLALNSWSSSLVLCTVVAVLQDPLRKLAPGQPVYFVVLVGVVFAAGWFGAYGSGVPLRTQAIAGWKSRVGAPFVLFVAVALAQALHSYARFGSLAMTGIGLLSYMSAIPAILLAYQYAIRRGVKGITDWMWVYVVLASLGLSGVYLEYLGVPWRTLGQVGQSMTVYGEGWSLRAYAGFFRAAEVAAWHSASVACWLVLLLFGKRRSIPGLVGASGLVALAIALGTLTGRRKLLIQIAVFACSYFGLSAMFQRNSRKVAAVIGVVGLVLYIFAAGIGDAPGDESSEDYKTAETADDAYTAYSSRMRSVGGDIGQRVMAIGVLPLESAYYKWGLFGAGLGAGSQGTQHFGGTELIAAGDAEGALGKLMLELGAPGLIVVLWLVVAMAQYFISVLEYLAATSATHARIGYCLVAFQIANAAVFSIATQVYGDLFVLLCLGWSVGFLLALPVLARRDVMAHQVRSASQVARVNPTSVARDPVAVGWARSRPANAR